MAHDGEPLGPFASFRYRDYHLFWIGLFLSNISAWMQMTAALFFLLLLTLGLPAAAAGSPAAVNRYLEQTPSVAAGSGQLVFVVSPARNASTARVFVYERREERWKQTAVYEKANVGKKGIAPFDKKREGDGRSPSGVFPLKLAFGYLPSIESRMPYRQAGEEDFWVDDMESPLYNRWVKGKVASSQEELRRKDDLYKYGIVIEYNTDPVVKGWGSAIFFHVWAGENRPTAGCVSLPEQDVIGLLKLLDPAVRPLAVIGTEEDIWPKDEALIDIRSVSPKIHVDMRYFRSDNFTGKKLYETNACLLRASTARKLDAAQKAFAAQGYGIKVWDCYRPPAVQKRLWEMLPDRRYVADPAKGGSRHNRGAAVDVTLLDREGREVDMPTAFDDFSERASRSYKKLPGRIIQHRKILEETMRKAGFVPLPTEWWHFDDSEYF